MTSLPLSLALPQAAQRHVAKPSSVASRLLPKKTDGPRVFLPPPPAPPRLAGLIGESPLLPWLVWLNSLNIMEFSLWKRFVMWSIPNFVVKGSACFDRSNYWMSAICLAKLWNRGMKAYLKTALHRGSQWGGGIYGYRLKFWLFQGYRLIFFSYG